MMGSGELLVILVVILILFGGKKLPEFARSLGQGIREFKRACYGDEPEVHSTSSFTSPENEKTSRSPSISMDSSHDCSDV